MVGGGVAGPGKGFVIVIFFVVAIAGLLFIPGLIGYAPGKKAPTLANPLEDPNLDPMERVIYELDAGVYDTSKKSEKLSEKQLNRARLGYILRNSPLSWETYRRAEIQQPVSEALKDSATFLKALDVKKTKSRLALIGFINALEGFLDSKPTAAIDPIEVLDYLSAADIQVTEALIAEGASGSEFAVWKSISIGALVGASGANRLKQEHTPPFTGNITLIDVSLDKRKDSISSAKGAYRWVYPLSFSAVIAGEDARAVEIYKGSKLLERQQITAKKESRNDGRVKIRFRAENAYPGTFTIRVINKAGAAFTKSYSFITGSQKLTKDSRGKFIIPKIQYNDMSLPPSDQLDKIFTYGGGSGDLFENIPGNTFAKDQQPSGWQKF